MTRKHSKETGGKRQAMRALVRSGAGRQPEPVTALFERIVGILEGAQARVVRAVNSEMVLAYWQIGREIVQYLQSGSRRAAYGDQLLDLLSARLQERVGRGYSVTNLKYFRLFYQTYANREPWIRHEARDELPGVVEKRHAGSDVSEALSRAAGSGGGPEGFSSRLSWTHYRILTKVAHPAERTFYEIEAELEGWSVPQLERQIGTQLFAAIYEEDELVEEATCKSFLQVRQEGRRQAEKGQETMKTWDLVIGSKRDWDRRRNEHETR